MADTKVIKIHQDDFVAVALAPLSKGESYLGVTLLEDIPQGHKFALKDIPAESKVIKYSYPIGKATQDIKTGSHVHVHNMKTLLSETAEYSYTPDEKVIAPGYKAVETNGFENKTIRAYRRPNGKIGIRNEIWIVPTVGCVNKLAERLANTAKVKDGIDGIHAWIHPYGCSQMGGDHEQTRTVLADLVNHPNAAAVLVLGLGCENNTVEKFAELVASRSPDGEGSDITQNGRIIYLTSQNSTDEIADGLAALDKLQDFACNNKREDVSISELVIGMKCGGSDGLSGITANALVGQICDRFTSSGSKVMLTEVPEMFGAEQMLMNRCVSPAIYNDTVNLINNFKDYFVRHGQTVYENPSPGNKAGGITTLEDKSLGCVQKGGRSPIKGVLSYGDIMPLNAEAGGVYLLEGPGNDIVSTTAMTAAGAHLILFTTGRGTPLGAPVPTVKIASNTPLAEHKSNWIDFNAFTMLTENACDKLSDLILDVASGKQTKNEANGYREIAILKDGVTL